MAEAKKNTKSKTASLADFQKKVDATRDVDPYLLDLGDGGSPAVIKDPSRLGVATMHRLVEAAGDEDATAKAGFGAFEDMFSPEDFHRVLVANPDMDVFAAVLADVADHYGLPSAGESNASRD